MPYLSMNLPQQIVYPTGFHVRIEDELQTGRRLQVVHLVGARLERTQGWLAERVYDRCVLTTGLIDVMTDLQCTDKLLTRRD